jgi:large subunit ribosomal protein L15
MDLSSLKAPKGASKSVKRVGRGLSSGHGNTSGRGNKGQKQRSGAKIKMGFEGGQMPLQRRIPHLRGFKPINRKEFAVVNVGDLDRFEDGATVTPQELKEKGLIEKDKLPIKVLGDGEIAKKIAVKANAFSAKARQKIEAAGGSVEVL